MEDACKAGVAVLVKQGNKKTFVSSTDNSGEFSAIRCKCDGKTCPKK